MTTTLPLFGQVHEAIGALRRDLIDPEDGPRISTMRNYRFAIVQYDPKDEYPMRLEVQKLTAELGAKGWCGLSIDLQKLLLSSTTPILAHARQTCFAAPRLQE